MIMQITEATEPKKNPKIATILSGGITKEKKVIAAIITGAKSNFLFSIIFKVAH